MSHIGKIASIVATRVKEYGRARVHPPIGSKRNQGWPSRDCLMLLKAPALLQARCASPVANGVRCFAIKPALSCPIGIVDVRTPTDRFVRIAFSRPCSRIRNRHIPTSARCRSHRPRYLRPMFDPCPHFFTQLFSNSPKNLVSRRSRRFRANLHLDLTDGPFTEDSLARSNCPNRQCCDHQDSGNAIRVACRPSTYDPE